jgi:hypothetical protein
MTTLLSAWQRPGCSVSLQRREPRTPGVLRLRRRRRIMDGLSGAASVIAVIDMSAKIVSLCFQYSMAVKDAKDDIERV